MSGPIDSLIITADKQYGSYSHFIHSCEYDDFIEFLQNELGFEYVKELQEKFYNTPLTPTTP